MGHVHIVGAGLAGLAAAVRLAGADQAVTLYDGAKQAGGRCRSFHDSHLDMRIDNGNHLMLSGNHAVLSYADIIGGRSNLYEADRARIPFLDLTVDERWCLDINDGGLPLWLFSPRRRVAGAGLWAHLKLGGLLLAKPQHRIADKAPMTGPLYERFLLPLTEAVMNAAPQEASADLLRAVLMETIVKGGAYCRPVIARTGLSDALVDPALDYLKRQQSDIRLGERLNGLEVMNGQATALGFARQGISLGPEDQVILALPPEKTCPLLGLDGPTEAVPIVNVHYRLDDAHSIETPHLLGLVGGMAHWIFRKGVIASVTISNAEDVAPLPAEDITERCWADVSRALGLPRNPMPPARVVKEKRATFRQTPEEVAKRPGVRTELANVYLAGDWTDTGLPATIEGAVRSGFKAADTVLAL